MTRTRGIALLTLVLLPLLLLGWFGARLSYEDQERTRQNIRDLLRARLEDNRDKINQITQRFERQLLQLFESWDQKDTTLHRWQREVPLVRQAFWIASNGRLRYPSILRPQTAQERDFLQRTRPIWEGTAILLPPTPTKETNTKNFPANAQQPTSQPFPKSSSYQAYAQAYTKSRPHIPQQQQQQTRPTQIVQPPKKEYLSATYPMAPQKSTYSTPSSRKGGDNLLSLARVFHHGWMSWYWAEGLHLLFWKRTPQREIIGVEVDRIVLLSLLTGQLPDNQARLAGRMMLLDGRASLIYQWGQGIQRYKPKPLLQLNLAYPLHSWSLAYNGPEALQIQGASGRYLFDMLLLFCGVALLLLALGTYIYREWSRDMREASQRVTFVTQVSHELKTPLTNIRLYAELLEKRVPEEDPRAQRHIRVIVDESQRLSRLIHNILTFSRQQRQKHKLHPQACDPHMLLQRTIEQFAPTFQTKGISIEKAAPYETQILADPDAVEQILGNLFNNIEKYAAEGAWMSIHFTQRNETHLSIEIRDRGPGIPAHLRDHVFQPFVRGSDKLSDGVTGTGIGLTIARELARQMGGELCLLESEQGAHFSLSLPLRNPTHREPSQKGSST